MVNIDVMIRVKGRISKTNIQTLFPVSWSFVDPCFEKKNPEPHLQPCTNERNQNEMGIGAGTR